MKTTNSVRLIVLSIVLTGMLFSCKKDSSSPSGDTTNASNLSTQADDQTMVSTESENLTNDINTALTSQVSTNGNSTKSIENSGNTAVNSVNQVNGVSSVDGTLICDAAVSFDTVSNPRKITISYNGTNCWGNRTRTGTVIISIAAGVHWLDQGAVVNVLVQDLKITRLNDSKSITINGIRTITNVSGGSLKNLASLGSITHTISDSVVVLFANNTSRVWHAAKQRVFSYNNGIVLTITGTHTDGNNLNIAEWGTNRFGIDFTTMFVQPIVIRQDCDFRIVSGQVQTLRSDNLNSTVTFGLDASGNATGCPGTGNYYLQLSFVASNGKTYPVILQY
ncbi:MAG: hypothetical protein ACHQEM_01125 [Chitinophagales bacterium]